MDRITERQTYVVYNGQPIDNDSPLKVCVNSLKLLFNNSTTVNEVDMPQIPTHKFKFKSIPDIMNGNFNPACLHGN